MSFGKAFELDSTHRRVSNTEWGASFPNPADINFNYRKLLDNVVLDGQRLGGIARNTNPNLRIGIVGAGIAGLTAARELLRCGYTKVDIFEASERYGGRHYTRTPSAADQYTPMDAGAMRFPPFLPPGETNIHNGCSILSYYMKAFQLTGEPFPNPGSPAADTGIYYNNGWLSDEPTPIMAMWNKTEAAPPTQALKTVHGKWQAFARRITEEVSRQYVTPNWPTFWKKIVDNYWHKTFRDVVLDRSIAYDPTDPGNFGGAGMTEEESTLFYLIGGGDGSWGAFYNLSFLYAYRTFVHGFGSNLFLLQGRFNSGSGALEPGPYYQNQNLVDHWGQKIPPPQYIGACALDDCMLFMNDLNVRTPSGSTAFNTSIYALSRNESTMGFDVNLHFKTRITDVRRATSGTSRTRLTGIDPRNQIPFSLEYDAVIFTVPTWQFGTDISVGFLDDAASAQSSWPFELQSYFSRADWEPACKVFVGLKEAYWQKTGNKIPQVITSDTFVHDAYALVANVGPAGGPVQKPVLLASYTWWRDATKLLSYTDADLVQKCVSELDRILMQSTNVGQKISDYVDFADSWVIRWETLPTYKGAARLYNQREWMDTQLPMAYNQEYSRNSKVYFAGEAYHVDAGWSEPCFRSAIDAVLHVARNNGAALNVAEFDFDRDYPLYDVDWKPAEPSLAEKRKV